MNTERAERSPTAYPEWTDYRNKGGQDPLGMQNSSVRIYQSLVPGISNVTLRIRYYGFYAWLAENYARQVGSTDPECWKRFLRRAEGLYALVAARHGGESGVAGIDWAHRRLAEAAEQTGVDFKADTEPGSDTHYLQQAWGNFGAAYRGQLFEIGIFDHADHAIPLPSKSIGEPLALAFSESLGASADRFLGCMESAKASLEDLDALRGCLPSQIDPASRERELYQGLLLGKFEPADSLSASARRLTLQLLLRTTALMQKQPSPEDFRWALYSGQDRYGNPLVLTDPEETLHRDHWWAYHANDLCQLACSTILKFTLDALERFPTGIPFHQLISNVLDSLLGELAPTTRSWSKFVDGLAIARNPSDVDDPTSEAALASEAIGAGRSDQSSSTPPQAAAAVMLLGVLHQRVSEDRIDLTAILGHLNPVGFRSVLSEISYLKAIGHLDLPEALHRLIAERILRRHLWVALKKLRYQGDYTFLIESDGGLLRLRGKDGPTFTNPRLRPAIHFLRDLHLIDERGLRKFGHETLAQ